MELPIFEIPRTKERSDIISDFVAIGNEVSGDKAVHVAILIQYKKVIYEFHFTGRKIELIELKNDYYHKRTEVILKDEIPAFLAMCKNILKKANPKFGYFYSGEFYNSDGKHFGNTNLGERMTCVGFCLNVFKGFLEEDYLNFEDWKEDTHDHPGYLEMFCKRNKIDINKIKGAHRRVTPKECLCSCYFRDLPIRKNQILKVIPRVNARFDIA